MAKIVPIVKSLLAAGPGGLARRAVVRVLAAMLPAHRTNKSGNNMSQR
ncbi:hypothetical protein LBMAG42_14030 [Deltaproteobacteria bacterium]|nr:hypothetical protein LBMAG42_14030 [Deltaproteobacteria bacterium]